MALSSEDLQQVKDFVQTHIVDWLPASVLQLNERIVRVEEELKHQRELIKEGFENADKRFADMNRRFDEQLAHADSRFEDMNRRFEEMQANSDKRFADMNRRFDEMRAHTDSRFEDMNRRFEEMQAHTEKRFNTLTWLIGVGFVVISSLITVFSLLA
jgi:flagellar capping protein FliD